MIIFTVKARGFDGIVGKEPGTMCTHKVIRPKAEDFS